MKISKVVLLGLVLLGSAAILNFSGCANKSSSTVADKKGPRGKQCTDKMCGKKEKGKKIGKKAHMGKGKRAHKKGKLGLKKGQGAKVKQGHCKKPRCKKSATTESMQATDEVTSTVSVETTPAEDGKNVGWGFEGDVAAE